MTQRSYVRSSEPPTVLLAGADGDIAGAQPWLNFTVAHLGALYDGVVEGFTITFPTASDAVACALDLQRAPLDPVALCIGLHTGGPDGPTRDCAAGLRDLARPGQVLLSEVTEALILDRLPPGASLTDLEIRSHRIVQLRHPALRSGR